MPLDKELYRKAQDQYRKWNEVERAARIRNAGLLQPAQAWRQYAGVFNPNKIKDNVSKDWRSGLVITTNSRNWKHGGAHMEKQLEAALRISLNPLRRAHLICYTRYIWLRYSPPC